MTSAFLDKTTWETMVPFNEVWKQFWKRSMFSERQWSSVGCIGSEQSMRHSSGMSSRQDHLGLEPLELMMRSPREDAQRKK